jgi:hypothetical protein
MAAKKGRINSGEVAFDPSGLTHEYLDGLVLETQVSTGKDILD